MRATSEEVSAVQIMECGLGTRVWGLGFRDFLKLELPYVGTWDLKTIGWVALEDHTGKIWQMTIGGERGPRGHLLARNRKEAMLIHIGTGTAKYVCVGIKYFTDLAAIFLNPASSRCTQFMPPVMELGRRRFALDPALTALL